MSIHNHCLRSLTVALQFAADGIALSAGPYAIATSHTLLILPHHIDGEYIYTTPLTSHRLYRIATPFLKQQPSSSNPYAAILAKENVQTLAGSAGHADGLETDASGYIYIGSQGKCFNARS